MDLTSRKQYIEVLRERYWKATKKEKGWILDEYCQNTGQERKYVIKKFNYKVKLIKESRKNRETIYKKDVVAVLAKIWKIFDYPCGQRLKPIIKQELNILNDLYYNELRLYKNFFQPVIKLKEKTRINGKIHKKYDKAKTPYQ